MRYLQSCILCKHELKYLLRHCISLLAPSLKLGTIISALGGLCATNSPEA